MAEKTEEEIDKNEENEALEELTIKNDEEEKLVPIDNSTSDENKTIENEDKDDEKKSVETEEIPVQKKQPKLQKILILIVGVLVVLLTIGIILYFIGFFDPEEKKSIQKDEKITKVKSKPKPEIVFDTQEINKSQLNKKLSMLTKKEIMNKEELEKEEQKLKEEEKRKKEAELKAIEDKKKEEEAKLAAQFAKIEEEKRVLKEHQQKIKQEQEEFIKLQEEARRELEDQKEELLAQLKAGNLASTVKINEKPAINEEIDNLENNSLEVPDSKEEMTAVSNTQNKMSNEFLSFINVATIKGELYKSYLDKVMTFDKNLSLCRDDKNRIEIYFGPYDSKNERSKVLDNLLGNGFKQSYLVDFTQEEYNKRCKY